MSVPRRPPALLAAPLLVLALLLTGCSSGPTPAKAPVGAPGQGAAGPESDASSVRRAPSGPETVPAPAPTPATIPGLGPQTLAEIPAEARQAFVVTGEEADANQSSAVLYSREGPGKGWEPVAGPWDAHNGMEGWTDHHVAGDLRSPTGVYTLTDAGGRLPDPGALLPYDEHPRFAVDGEGFFGEPLEGSFDYVVAINYNRTEGVSPLDRTRPLGLGRGGGIWIHVDHGGPTQGCVSIPENRMRELLRTLDPALHPVIVMGDAETLGR
ncbi:L,D-transpeptidase family protein [Streptomyces sp. V2I9]|uniref:L,D-transpeptidase family protein n=1 Tax=Streptomyces sp. V2I9 TaxID=3042304 RepID=UPI00278BAAB9|nr:L,D-transpeptidase family protein [Streptomyces sp. V2I9]MDQ0985706.1 L,D-peptidoglycan transpeptidase YkuD (ErfK/YbiS/YcfS/YnhG family) [Streptomyces sp. V2I9]